MKILTALDRSEYAEIVLEHGLDQASRHPGAEMHFVTIVDRDGDVDDARNWLEDTVREDLDAFNLATSPITLHARRGRIAPQIAALASEIHADLLVIGRFGVPTDSETILAVADCPTLVVGIDGPVLEPQCPACSKVRAESDGEHLFCDAHHSDRMSELVSRIPPTASHSHIW